MEELNALKWLFQQTPLVIACGIAIWWLVKKLERSEEKKDKISEDVVKLTVLWTEKSDSDGAKDEEIKQLLLEIREIVRNNG